MRSHDPQPTRGKKKGIVRSFVAALVAATILAGGITSTANAEGGGGFAPGGGGDQPAEIGLAYHDHNDGGWGGMNLASFKKAVAAMGATYNIGKLPDADAKANTAITMANDECVARFNKLHPGETADCRMVAVGVVVTATTHNYSGIGSATSSYWKNAWDGNASVQETHFNDGEQYLVSDSFSDSSRTVNDIAAEQWKDPNNPVVIVIALNQYEPVDPETPPTPPSKTVTSGVSADSMTNTTVITTGTGVGGTSMVIRDTINANGMAYTVTGQKVTDTTTGEDVSSKFTFNTADGSAAPDNVATATWNGGDLPDEHEFAWELTITVSLPEVSKVEDTPSVVWNDEGTGDVEGKSFDTWRPAPDKSWILWDSAASQWKAVVDSDHTNSTGADGMTFLDGDRVGSVVNGVVAADLAQAPETFVLEDDWTDADYIFDADDVSKLRVYESDASDGERSSVADIANTGRDVTDQFDIEIRDTKAVATAKKEYREGLKGMDTAKQVTLLVPGTVNFANGGGAAQVRSDFGKEAGDEITFCSDPSVDQDPSSPTLTNAGSQTVNKQTVETNEPYICGYVPPVKKDVIAEASQGGGQESVDGKIVYPGQRVEYQLTTEPQLPSDLAYGVSQIVFTDTFDEYLTPDKQTVEMMDLSTGKVVPKSKYETKWDDEEHLFQLAVTDADLIAQWRAGSTPRVQIRFEGTVDEDAPTDHQVGNEWMLIINNSLTPSNRVFNLPPDFEPSKKVTQSASQGDPSVSIDGKTMLLGDTGNYVIDLDLTQKDTAYRVWKAGIVDDYDQEYVTVNEQDIEVLSASGEDVTDKFNVAIIDGVAYVFARTVDTPIPATGETVKGDPQPTDLKAYAVSDEHDPLADPSIDQALLGQTYQVVLPYVVSKVDDGYTVVNEATQVLNDQRKTTNQVSNPLKPINPSKDVVVSVDGDSVDGHSIWLDRLFLYRLDSSVLPVDRAYPEVTDWSITDPFDVEHDEYQGAWAAYLARDLYKDGEVIAKAGEKVAGTGFDSSKFGGDLFEAVWDEESGTFTVSATQLYLGLVSADTEHEAAWYAFPLMRRIALGTDIENSFTETINGVERPSNVVRTNTPDTAPSIHVEKFDEGSGWPDGDRDDTKDALELGSKGEEKTIVFRITNTSKTDPETGEGAWFQAKDLDLTDETVAGDGEVVDLEYPADWDTLVLKPGDSVDVKGTLKGVTDHHTDRAQVTGTPLFECPATIDPLNPDSDDTTSEPGDNDGEDDATTDDADSVEPVEIEGRLMCADTSVTSNTDDWNAKVKPPLADTGLAIGGVVVAAILIAGAGLGLLAVRRKGTGSQARHSA
ncbi:LPXTG cell wall anchor domain-containing protein [Bifidobacterium lemurum]|nr:LPXTG cell wall anchor domain-containing protein [Bifidobacterium lemurum]